jgi:hypothetical protein
MPPSQFTAAQEKLIQSYMSDFEAMTLKVDPTLLANTRTTEYRQNMTKKILSDELFKDDLDKDLQLVRF